MNHRRIPAIVILSHLVGGLSRPLSSIKILTRYATVVLIPISIDPVSCIYSSLFATESVLLSKAFFYLLLDYVERVQPTHTVVVFLFPFLFRFAGSYMKAAGASICNSCPAGMKSAIVGATLATVCR